MSVDYYKSVTDLFIIHSDCCQKAQVSRQSEKIKIQEMFFFCIVPAVQKTHLDFFAVLYFSEVMSV